MIPFPNKKYQIIYADPPWKYKRDGNHSAASVYDVMNTEDIKKLDVKNITTDEAHLYLWVTNPFIKEGLEVCESWGFNYKTLITWIKTYKDNTPIMGMGYYFRGATEHLIFGVKGKMLCKNKNTKNIFFSNQKKHSQKPDEFKNIIINCSGDLPRIELFARQKTEGWDAWGNEV
jgi:N6-adenosine-specific RNA methylase IME4